MPKKRKKKKPVRSKRQSRQANKDQHLILLEYTVTFDPIKNKDLETLPPDVQERVEQLFHQIHADPQPVIPELEKLVERYPLSLFYNYLTSAYFLSGDTKRAETLAFEAYQKFPDYLFARLNYAQICLDKGEIEKIPEIFDNKFDLKLIYPKRSVFHVSEVMNFNYVMGMYFARIGKIDTAKVYYQVLKQIDPADKMTKHLELLLAPALFLDRIKTAVEKEPR